MTNPKSYHYANVDAEFLTSTLRPEGRIYVAEQAELQSSDRATRIALTTLAMAQRLGIKSPSKQVSGVIPYSEESDATVFSAPVLSDLLDRNVFLLRGWKQFQSCIKGFNALGLMAEQIVDWRDDFEKRSNEYRFKLGKEFLSSKNLDTEQSEINTWFNSIDLAIWACFSKRAIVCSTSSNMGISLHEVLRLMQTKIQHHGSTTYTILSPNEGSLIIWCPDERADFMNPEKAKLLRTLEAELPALTSLRTYINRQQRDPGALMGALNSGGYFFPTNPQSAQELQNLLFGALVGDGGDVEKSVATAVESELAVMTLSSLGCVVNSDECSIEVRRGVEGGVHGLMLPYWILLEEICELMTPGPLDIWNQASIGAALAAAVMAENILNSPTKLSDATRSDFSDKFPHLTKSLSSSIDRPKQRSIIGVFDIANLQSLAQLLGVTVEKHAAGRSTAFVGLGSASYSNGNRCFEILDESIQNAGPFAGRNTFFAATHTLNPVAQALVVGEDTRRLSNFYSQNGTDCLNGMISARKPEPAGAAALAGVLLRVLDCNELTVFEIASCLRELGFNTNRFLRLHFGQLNDDSEQTFIQSAFEEGPYMGQFASDLLLLLNWPLDVLKTHARRQRTFRESERPAAKTDSHGLVVYLTGDNCTQPAADLLVEINQACKLTD